MTRWEHCSVLVTCLSVECARLFAIDRARSLLNEIATAGNCHLSYGGSTTEHPFAVGLANQKADKMVSLLATVQTLKEAICHRTASQRRKPSLVNVTVAWASVEGHRT